MVRKEPRLREGGAIRRPVAVSGKPPGGGGNSGQYGRGRANESQTTSQSAEVR